MNENRSHVLVIGMLDSIHLARWLEQFVNDNTDFVLFPSTPHRRIHRQIKALLSNKYDATFTISLAMRFLALPIGILDIFFRNKIRGRIIRRVINNQQHFFHIVHAHETQHAGYLASIALRDSYHRPKLFLSLWGSDLFWFKQFKKHRRYIQETLKITDQLILECRRDINLANEFGYTGKEPILISASGGLKPEEIDLALAWSRPSERKQILIKGYMGFVGRADLALAAIEKMSTELAAYEIIVYSTDIHSRRIIKRLRRTTNLNLRSFKKHSFDHSSMMDLFRQSRIHIGISESDGIPGSLREAMLSGCIPIQTNTSCADEWISNYKSGFLVSINDINQIIDAIRTALYNVDLIDSAAELNRIAAFNYLSRNSNQDLIQDLYHC